jgi:hypothetical protein
MPEKTEGSFLYSKHAYKLAQEAHTKSGHMGVI